MGIVYSAADVLSPGHLGYSNQGIQNAWAISQALAIELIGGVVLVYGLRSLREKDTIKRGYTCLSRCCSQSAMA